MLFSPNSAHSAEQWPYRDLPFTVEAETAANTVPADLRRSFQRAIQRMLRDNGDSSEMLDPLLVAFSLESNAFALSLAPIGFAASLARKRSKRRSR